MKVLTNEISPLLLRVFYVTQLDLLLTTAMNVLTFLPSSVQSLHLYSLALLWSFMRNFEHYEQLSSGELYSHHVATNDFSMFDYFFINNMKVKALAWFYSRE